MQRCLLAFVMVLGISIVAGTRASHASTIEKWLIMPGPVTASHAEFEEKCDSCHDPLSDRPQFKLCVSCHVEIADDLANEAGLHGHLPANERNECADCHAEHEGREFDITRLNEAKFDHDLTNFALHGAHIEVACVDCHAPNEPRKDAGTMCIDCHLDDDPHDRQFGDDCSSCHTVNDWMEATFDHSLTEFPLTGAHANTTCQGCHLSSDFSDVGKTCNDCHKKDDVHEGRNGVACADCHTTSTWSDWTFNHLAVTGFALDFGHKGLTCADCHSAPDFRDRNDSTCVSCHLGDDVHDGTNGTDCASCHSVKSWRTVSFNHATSTDFPLPAGHEDLECTACHVTNIHDDIPRDCGGCHIDDDPHEGQLGTRCEGCHVAEQWTGRLWFDHDLTRFPLLGSHADVGCNDCHESLAFRDAGESCIDCHAADDVHDGGLGNQCDACHNPSTWRAWVFDHDAHTDFPLTGAHIGLACADCHKESGNKKDAAIAGGCSSCHRRDDPHDGRFGDNCENCHSTSTFSRIEGM